MKIILDPCQRLLHMIVFAKLVFQPLQRFSTPGRGRCVKDYLRLLTEVAVLVFGKGSLAGVAVSVFFIFQPIRRLPSTPDKGCMLKACDKAV